MVNPADRFITPEKGAGLFAMQLDIFPELRSEFELLSGGSIGVVRAIIEKMGDAISEDPMQETTVTRLRDVLGAPTDPKQLDEWRRGFWDAFKAEREARHSSSS
jgi:hypothetical protein